MITTNAKANLRFFEEVLFEIFAPIFCKGSIILIIGRFEREASPVNVDEKFNELKNPANSLMPVPELPK